MTRSRIRVLIADDHPITADGLRLHLETSLMIELVGVATSFAQLRTLVETTPADVLLLDVTGMQGSAIATIHALRRDHPSIALVIFSSIVGVARDLLAAGAHGYVVKEEHARHLLHAIHAAHHGQRYLSPIVEEYLSGTNQPVALHQLAPKEQSVLELLDKELSTTEIATQLVIDARTVQNYITSMIRKVGVKSRYQLTMWYRNLPKEVDSAEKGIIPM